MGGISCWAAHATFNCSKPQLYDLSVDVAESRDLALQHPDVLAAIEANFSAWFASVNNSIANESKCAAAPHPPVPVPFPRECGAPDAQLSRAHERAQTPARLHRAHSRASAHPPRTSPASLPAANPPPSTNCTLFAGSALSGSDIATGTVADVATCCGACLATPECAAADFAAASPAKPTWRGEAGGGTCHLKAEFSKKAGGAKQTAAHVPGRGRR